ncbi:M55 family metallopeptidase [Enterococcus sp. LJL120]
MKIFISADIEGVAGIGQWNETESGPWYDYFSKEMSREVAAACEGALAAGATEIYVKDGHHTACNIYPDMLPKEAVLNRGWSGDGYGMMSGVQDDVDFVVMIGYHAASYSDANPLSHTSENYIRKFEINGQLASEFMINRYIAALHQVPVIFLSGDQGIVDEVRATDPGISTFATLQGRGGSTTSVHPEIAYEKIKEGVRQAVTLNKYYVPELPEYFDVKITYQEQNRARKAALFPGAKLIDPYTVQFETGEYFEFLRFYTFVG